MHGTNRNETTHRNNTDYRYSLLSIPTFRALRPNTHNYCREPGDGGKNIFRVHAVCTAPV